jgi:hypothetical protein
MKNRYGNEYWFEQLQPNTFTIKGELTYWRFGGREGQDSLDYNDLGFVDPSGGPFIGIGYSIEGRKVVNISVAETSSEQPYIIFKVE